MYKKKILILGSSGYIGKNLKEFLVKEYLVIAPSHNELDLLDRNYTRSFFKVTKPDIVINLVVPLSVLIQRLSSRRICRNCGSIFNLLTLKPKKAGVCDNCGGSLYQREDDTPKEKKRRLEKYETLTKPLLNFYNKRKIVANVECNQADIPPEIIVEKIRQAIINRLRK